MAGDATFRERASVMKQLGRGTHIAIIMGLMVLRLNQVRTKHHCSAKICRISYNVGASTVKVLRMNRIDFVYLINNTTL